MSRNVFYSVIYCEDIHGDSVEVYNVGVFNFEFVAQCVLRRLFEKACGVAGIDTLLRNEEEVDVDSSYYDEGENCFRIVLKRNGDVYGELSGRIDECKLNDIRLNLNLDD